MSRSRWSGPAPCGGEGTGPLHLAVQEVRSPLGPLTVVASEEGIRAVRFGSPPRGADVRRSSPLARRRLAAGVEALLRYLEGGVVPRVALDWQGVGSFQRLVLETLSRVCRDRTATYGELAAEVGRPGAARAVGRALATNPYPLLLPCHRVVAADGSLGGYLGGRELKRRLLQREGLLQAQAASSGAPG